MGTVTLQEKREYRFEVTPRKGEGVAFQVQLRLSQEEFESFQVLRQMIWAELGKKGLREGDAAWTENPVVDQKDEELVRKALGARDDARMILCYRNAVEQSHYRQVAAGGKVFACMAFAQGNYIKYALVR